METKDFSTEEVARSNLVDPASMSEIIPSKKAGKVPTHADIPGYEKAYDLIKNASEQPIPLDTGSEPIAPPEIVKENKDKRGKVWKK